MMRLFVGLTLPQSVKQGLIGLMAGLEGVKWQSKDQLHLTLNFIGEVAEPQAEEIDAALAAVPFESFLIGLSGIDIFGNRRRPRMLWTGVRQEDIERLQHLHAKVDRILQRCGRRADPRKYIPHVTLARFRAKTRRIGPYLEHYAAYKSPAFEVNAMTLFRSHLGHQGAQYVVVASYPGKSNAVPV
jgi:2'-5' RNA ligase